MKGHLDIKRIILLSLIVILLIRISNAQIIKGRITDQTGEAIPFATVYIPELKQGTTSGQEGDYLIKLPAGKYHVTYLSPGYDPVFYDVLLTYQTILRNIILPIRHYEIPEVNTDSSREDPACRIMRKAIGLAPYYRSNVIYYKANINLKGNLVLRKTPKLLQKSFKIDKSDHGSFVLTARDPGKVRKTLKRGDTFLMESVNEINFTAPDKYVQNLISLHSTFPEYGNVISPMDLIQSSFYSPVLADIVISPLSPQAFLYYEFRYLGATKQGSFTINKIEVIPKRKSQQSFYGTIYIINDLWCLQSVDLSNDNITGKIRVRQLFVPVQDDIWMPVSYKFEINPGKIGYKSKAGYEASIKYLDVRPNVSLKGSINEIKSNTSPYSEIDSLITTTKTKEQIEKILQKEDLSNGDMVKLSKLMKKESEESLPDTILYSPGINENTTLIAEKVVNKKDSVPGTKSRFMRNVKDISLGHTWSGSSGFSFTNGGLINLKNLSFNTVDGFVYGIDFRISKTWNESNVLSFYPVFRWAFSRETMMWMIDVNYKFGGFKPKMLSFRAGMTSKDINNINGISPLLNTVTTLFLKKNYLKLYGSTYFSLSYRFEIVNGLSLDLNGSFDNRRVLDNTTNFSLSKSSLEYSANVPDNVYLGPGSNPINSLRDQLHAEFVTNVTFIPFKRYSSGYQRKISNRSEWPAFSLTWKYGLNEFSELSDKFKHYNMIRFDIDKNQAIGTFSVFSWRLRTVGFLNNAYLTYYDFFHFNSQSLSFLLDNYQDAFMLPAYYSLSTPEFFGEIHVKYTTPYLLLKLLPGLSNTLIHENLSISYLGSRYHQNYTEIGYSINGIMLLGEIGVYIGFEDLKYKRIGANVVLRFK